MVLSASGSSKMSACGAQGASQPPVGVAMGSVIGHGVATLIAVVGGGVASKYISERQIAYVSGALFLLFAFLTALGLF